MRVVEAFALFLIITTIVLVTIYGMSLSRKAKSASDRIFLSRLFMLLAITFVAGGITRTIQQNTGVEWLNGFVPIFGGLFMSLWGVPFLWRINKEKMKGLKRLWFFLPGMLLILLGMSVIYVGITQVWNALF